MKKENNILFYFFVIILYLGYISFTIIINRKELLFYYFLITLFFLYFITKLFLDKQKLEILLLGILFRIITIGNIPILSDDWNRFYWDGFLFSNFYNPYSYSPEAFIKIFPEIPINLYFNYNNMNSSNYYSIYPPLLQFIFSIPWIIGIELKPEIIYQVVLLIIETLVLIIIYIINKRRSNLYLWLYSANPLIVLESVSQIHFDSLVLLIILLLIKYYKKEGSIILSIFLFLLISVKISLIMLSFILYFNIKKNEKIYIIYLTILITLYMIFTFKSGDQINLGLGLFLYSFRFNGIFESILYYLINYINPDFNYISGFCSITLFLIYSIFFIKKISLGLYFGNFTFSHFYFFL